MASPFSSSSMASPCSSSSSASSSTSHGAVNRLQQALGVLGNADECQAFLTEPTRMWSASTTQKHAWVQKLWTGFCHAFEFPTWTLFSLQIKSTMVCTRVIKGSLSLTDPALHTSAAFHGLDVGAFSLSSRIRFYHCKYFSPRS